MLKKKVLTTIAAEVQGWNFCLAGSGSPSGRNSINFLNLRSGASVIKLFTTVIYHHSMVILSFCVIKLHQIGNYLGMAVNYHGILTLEKVRLKLQYCFITLAPGHQAGVPLISHPCPTFEGKSGNITVLM
jgi:hypothetical protein